ncbi:MAG: type II secretion system protein N [Sideroxydans sp.]|nr:type II secretion system protein N [Sideroxydans sp.]
MSRLPKLISFALFIVLCMSSAWWLMPLFSPAPRALSAPASPTLSAPNLSAAAALLGGQTSLATNNQYQLTGIVRAQDARDSVAILSTAGQPAISVKVGTKLAAEMSVSEIHADYVLLDDHGHAKRIALASENKAALKVNPPPNPNQLKSFSP